MLIFLQDKLSAIFKIVKDLIFPVFCLSCQTEGHWLCPGCLEQLKKEIKLQFFCPYCYNDNQDGRTCLACRPFSFLDRIISLASYENKIIAKMIQLLKYDYVEEIAEVFEKLIDDFVDRLIEPSQSCHSRGSGNPVNDIIVLSSGFPIESGMTDYNSKFIIRHSEFIILPVPLHHRRYLERGFNQAALLAQVWAKHLGLPTLSGILVRQRPTKTQVGLRREDRRQNLLGAFRLKKPFAAQRVILIDDVFTTGATLQECARVLKEGGVREVWGLTVARER